MLIGNKNQAIIQTDYWDSELARAGLVFLSWNAGAGRLMIPDPMKGMLREIRKAREVIVSRGPWHEQGGREALELMWEDDSDAPYCVHVGIEQTDRLLPDTDQGGGFVITAWTRGGLKGRWPGRYRKVDRIPCAKAWESH